MEDQLAPAQGDVYSIERSPGKCFATTVILAVGYVWDRTSEVVRPITPAPRTRMCWWSCWEAMMGGWVIIDSFDMGDI